MRNKKGIAPHLGDFLIGQIVCVSLPYYSVDQVRVNGFAQ